jgi:hypothetical protein
MLPVKKSLAGALLAAASTAAAKEPNVFSATPCCFL